jgi:hypothetical protein
MSRRPYPLSYRRTADAQTAPHRVVAQPIGPFPRTSPTQHPPPVLYDTSVSSATLTNSAEDIRSTGSGAGCHPSNRSPLHQQTSAGVSSPSYRTVPQKQSGLFLQNYEAAAQHANSKSPQQYPPSNITQSEPGVPTQEHDRFAAYVNRFAELDPRMDHRLYNTACKNQAAIEEKKLDDVLVSVIEQQEQLLLSKDRFRSRAAQRPQGHTPQNRHSDQLNMSVPKSRSQDVNGSSNDVRMSSSRDDAASDFVFSSPSGRTRDLARRFEQRMAEKQQQQERMECDAPLSQPSTAGQTPVAQPHYFYPQARLAATYIPVSKQATQSAGLKKAPSDERDTFSNIEETYGKHDLEYENDETLLNRSRSVQQSLSDNDAHLYRRSPQSYDTLHHSNISRAPSYLAEFNGPSSIMEEGKIPLEGSERKVNFDQRQHQHYPQIDPISSSERNHFNGSEQTGQQASRYHHSDIEDAPSRQRSESLGPPIRRRPRSLNALASVEPVVNTHRTDVVNRPAEEPNIRRLGHRAEIETPSPARVQELRKKLWTEDELLQVRVRSSYHDTEDSHRARAANYGPEMAGSAGQRNARSLSPKAKRSHNDNAVVPPSSSIKSREHKGMLFKSRYYEAALRGEAGIPSKPASSNRDERLDSTLQIKRSFESSSAKMSLRSGKSSDMKEDVDTTQAVPSAETNKKASKAVNKSRSSQIRHLEKLRETNTAMKDDTALSLIRKITLVNKDDPQAALAQIQALLQQQQHESKSVPVGDPELTVLDSIVGRDSASAPAVEKAHPMDGGNESDDESDGTSVSSMTNPTYQELNAKENAMNSAAAGRPRPSFLGGYANSASQQLANQNNATAPEEYGTPSPVDAMRNGNNLNSDFPIQTAEAPPTVPRKEAQITEPCVNSKSSPSFFAQLSTLIAPRRDDSKAHAEELVTKIQMWDDMSTGVIPAASYSQKPSDKFVHPERKLSTGTTMALGSIVTNSRKRDTSPGNELKRAHPWDASIPVRMGQIDVKDTSMDCGDGVEAQYTPKYVAAALVPSDRENPQKHPRKDLMIREMPAAAKPPVASKFADDGVDDVNSNLVKASQIATETLQVESRQQQQAKALSDEFDSAWVSLPSSTYFGAKSARSSVPRSSVALQGPQRPDRTSPIREQLSKDEETEYLPDGEVEVRYLNNASRNHPPDIQIFSPEEGDSLPSNPPYKALGSSRGSYPRHQKSSTFDGNHDPDRQLKDSLKLNGSFESGTVRSLETPQQSRGRGLRGFLKRKQAERDKRDGNLERDAMTSSSMGSTRRSIGNHTVATQPLGYAVDVEESPPGNDAAKSSRYYRRSSKSRSPSRGRARSLDERRIRNPSLARKFNRLLRVYDRDSEDLVS